MGAYRITTGCTSLTLRLTRSFFKVSASTPSNRVPFTNLSGSEMKKRKFTTTVQQR